jgi:hypothetical protein
MTHGKLDEELSRMSGIADAIAPGALLLCNESFAATNEREGSEIARQVIDAFVESEVTVVFATTCSSSPTRCTASGSGTFSSCAPSARRMAGARFVSVRASRCRRATGGLVPADLRPPRAGRRRRGGRLVG